MIVVECGNCGSRKVTRELCLLEAKVNAYEAVHKLKVDPTDENQAKVDETLAVLEKLNPIWSNHIRETFLA